ncbi:unnamed protein product [Calypogeia fissa]
MSRVKNSRTPLTHRMKTGWGRGLCWEAGYQDQGGFPPNHVPFETNRVCKARWLWPQDKYPRGPSQKGSGLPWRPKPQLELHPIPNFPFQPDFSRNPRWEKRHRNIEASARGSGLPWNPKPRRVVCYRLPAFPTPAFRGSERVLSPLKGRSMDTPHPPYKTIKELPIPTRPFVWRKKFCKQNKC